jgi:RimJ/RimL family protein N-acetyltransferase
MRMPEYLTLLPLFDELHGERVVVRPYHPEDAAALRAAVEESRELVRPWLPFADAHQTEEETRDWIIRGVAKWLTRANMPLSIWDAASGRYLGGVGLHPRNWEIRSFEIGYWLRQSAEGHGYVREAVRLVTDFAFAHLEAKRVEIRCDERNRRSAAVAEALGFVREARLRNDARANDGRLSNTLVFALIPDDPRWPSSGR